MNVTVGTDTYGRVKAVGGTSIVTKFAMLQSLPIYPLQSYYSSGGARTERSDVPFVLSSQTVAFVGVPLTRLDRISVVIAYVRGVFAALMTIGFLAIVPAIMQATGEHLDEFAVAAMRALIGCFVFGVTGGLLTYAVPLTPRRERRIREYCGEVLGFCVDPARVGADTSRTIEDFLADLGAEGLRNGSRREFIRRLVSARAQIAQGHNVISRERETDELLDRLASL